MNYYLNIINNRFYTKALYSFLNCLFLACLIYGCNTKNISNYGGQDGQIGLPHHSNGSIEDLSIVSDEELVKYLHNQLKMGNKDQDYFNQFLDGFHKGDHPILINLLEKENREGDNFLHHAVKSNPAIFMIIIRKLFSIQTPHSTIDEILDIKNNDRLTFIDLITVNGNIDLIKKIFEESEQYGYTIQTYILQDSINFAKGDISSNKNIENIDNIKTVIQEINDYIKKHTNQNDNLQEKSELLDLDDIKIDDNQAVQYLNDEINELGKHVDEITKTKTLLTKKSDRIVHEKIHTGEKNHQCQYCPKAFNNKSNCTKHEKIHTGEKNHQCQYCSKKFTNTSDRKVHEIRIHTGKKTHKCQYCSKKFARKSERTAHEIKHTGAQPYQCQYCPKAFNEKGNWTKHEKIHTGEQSYQCQYCPRAFNNKSNCRTHETTQHPLLNLDNLDIDMVDNHDVDNDNKEYNEFIAHFN